MDNSQNDEKKIIDKRSLKENQEYYKRIDKENGDLAPLYEKKKAVLEEIADLQKQIDEKKAELIRVEITGTPQEVRFLKQDISKLSDEIEKKLKKAFRDMSPKKISDLRLAVTSKLQNYRDDVNSKEWLGRKKYRASLISDSEPLKKYNNVERKENVDAGKESAYDEEHERLVTEIERLTKKQKPYIDEMTELDKQVKKLQKEARKLAREGDGDASVKKNEEAGKILVRIAEISKEVEPISNELFLNQMFKKELEAAKMASIKNEQDNVSQEYDMLSYANEALSEFYYDYFDLEEPEEPAKPEPAKTGAETQPEPPKTGTETQPEPAKTGTETQEEPAKTGSETQLEPTLDEIQRSVQFYNTLDELKAKAKEITSNSKDDRIEEIFTDIKNEYDNHYKASNTRDEKMSKELKEKLDSYLKEIVDAVNLDKENNQEIASDFFQKITQDLTQFFGEVKTIVDEKGESVEETAKQPEPAQTEPVQPEPAPSNILPPASRYDMTLIDTRTIDEKDYEYYKDADGKVYIYDEANDTLEYSEEETLKSQKENPEKADEETVEIQGEENVEPASQRPAQAEPEPVKQDTAQPTSIDPALKDEMKLIGIGGIGNENKEYYADKDGKVYIYDRVNNTLEYSEEKTNFYKDEETQPKPAKTEPVKQDPAQPTIEENLEDKKFEKNLENLNQLLLNSYSDKEDEIKEIIDNVKRLAAYRDCMPDLQREFVELIKKSINNKILAERGEDFEDLVPEIKLAVGDVTEYFRDNEISDDVKNIPEMIKIISFTGELINEIKASGANEEQIKTGIADTYSALASCFYYDYLNDKQKVKEKFEACVQRLGVDKIDEIFEKYYEEKEQEDSSKIASNRDFFEDYFNSNDESSFASSFAPSSDENSISEQDIDKEFNETLTKFEEFLKEVNVAENEDAIKVLLEHTSEAYNDDELSKKAQKPKEFAKQMKDLYDELGNLYGEVVFTGNQEEDDKKIAYLEVLMLKLLGHIQEKVELIDKGTISKDGLKNLQYQAMSMPTDTLESKKAQEVICKITNYYEKNDLNEKINPTEFVDALNFVYGIGLLEAAEIMSSLKIDDFEKPDIEKEAVAATEEPVEATIEASTDPVQPVTEPVAEGENGIDGSESAVESAEKIKTVVGEAKEAKPAELKKMKLGTTLKEYRDIIFGSINGTENEKEVKKAIVTNLEKMVELYDSLKPISIKDFNAKLDKIKSCSDYLTVVHKAQLAAIEKTMKDDLFANQIILGKTQEDEMDEYFDYKDGKIHKFSDVSLATKKETDVVANEKDMPDLFFKFVDAQAVEAAIAEVEDFLSEKTKPKRYKGPKGLFEVLKTKAELFKQNAFLYKALRRKRQNGEKGNTPLESLRILKNPAERQKVLDAASERIKKEIEDLRSGAILPSDKTSLTRLMSKTIYKHRTNSLGKSLCDGFTFAGLIGGKQYAKKKELLEEARELILKTMRETGEDGFFAEFNGKEQTPYSTRDGEQRRFIGIDGDVSADKPGLKRVSYQELLDQIDINIGIQEAYRAEKEAQKEAEKNDDDAR